MKRSNSLMLIVVLFVSLSISAAVNKQPVVTKHEDEQEERYTTSYGGGMETICRLLKKSSQIYCTYNHCNGAMVPRDLVGLPSEGGCSTEIFNRLKERHIKQCQNNKD